MLKSDSCLVLFPQIVGRGGDDEVYAIVGEATKELDAVARMYRVEFHAVSASRGR
jgi:hypothetical protein